MGQKINPNLFRLKISKPFASVWFAEKTDFAKYLKSDHSIRRFLQKELRDADLDKIDIERLSNKVICNIYTGKPGVVIGRNGENIEKLKQKLNRLMGEHCEVNAKEVGTPEFSANIQARNICNMLERRMAFRRVAKGIIEKIMQKGAKGVKVRIAGRLNGADIARAEVFKDGDISLQTMRTNINYAHQEANTTFGILGVKVWINHSK